MKRIILLLTFTLLNFTIAFGQKPVTQYQIVQGHNESIARSYFNRSQIDVIEGIWQSNDGFKYSIEKKVVNKRRGEGYRMVLLSHNTDSSFWKETYIKGFIEKTATKGVFNIDYYTAGEDNYGNTDIEVQTCIGFLETSALFTFTKQDGEKIVLIKIYPKTDSNNSETFSSSDETVSLGTGFAISSNGYIVSNYHVVKNARSIEVKGVNGNLTKKLTAEIVVKDEKNDLVIIKINDPNFTSLGSIPYTFRQGIADVGENVFVLGYPMTGSMGEEIKLTNGIISSKTGFKGDVSTYQFSAPIQSGNSGGPLFDKNGNLLGIVNAKHSIAENASYAIKVNYLKSLIEMLPQKISQPTLNTLKSKSLTEQVKIASNYTYLIIINDKSGNNNKSNAVVSRSTEPTKVISSQSTANTNYRKAEELFEKAEKLFEKGEVKEALEQVNLSIATFSDAGAYYLRALIYSYGIRDYEKAIDDFTTSIQMQPEIKEGYLNRGLVYQTIGKKIEAIKDFTKVINIDKENTDAYFLRALVKSEVSDRQGAISDYDEIIKREQTAKPVMYNMATVYNNKAYCLTTMNKPKDALPLVNKALELDRNTWYIWDTRGEINYALGKYKDAISDMDRAIELEEHDNSFYIRGLSRLKLGRKAEGCKDLSRAGEFGKLEAYEAINRYCN